MSVAHHDPLHPLRVEPHTGLAELAGIRYLASRQVSARDGRAVLYLTEARGPEHLYKFVGPAQHCGALSHGILYAASFGDEGHGRWLPLVLARHGLSPRDGYDSEQAILANARDAARCAGATSIQGLFVPQARRDGGRLVLSDQATQPLIWRESMGDAASLSFTWQDEAPSCRRETNLHHRPSSGQAMFFGM
jgi:hypothetical protein